MNRYALLFLFLIAVSCDKEELLPDPLVSTKAVYKELVIPFLGDIPVKPEALFFEKYTMMFNPADHPAPDLEAIGLTPLGSSVQLLTGTAVLWSAHPSNWPISTIAADTSVANRIFFNWNTPVDGRYEKTNNAVGTIEHGYFALSPYPQGLTACVIIPDTPWPGYTYGPVDIGQLYAINGQPDFVVMKTPQYFDHLGNVYFMYITFLILQDNNQSLQESNILSPPKSIFK